MGKNGDGTVWSSLCEGLAPQTDAYYLLFMGSSATLTASITTSLVTTSTYHGVFPGHGNNPVSTTTTTATTYALAGGQTALVCTVRTLTEAFYTPPFFQTHV